MIGRNKKFMDSCNDVRITYLYNSGVAIEFRDILLIFDYYIFIPADHGEGLTSGIVPETLCCEKKKVYIFVTHGHIDHYSEEILKWGNGYENVVYILPEDLEVDSNVNHIQVGTKLKLDDLIVTGCQSNDIGVSYYVELYGLKIFHAGDLNIWYWAPEDGKENRRKKIEYQIAKMTFLKALNSIKGLDVDIAFFPVDPQIGGKYYEGGLVFCREINPKLFVPVHFGVDYFATDEFKKIIYDTSVNVWAIHNRGDQYIYSLNKGEK